MRILVTGGAGFIGSNLVHHLLGAGGEAPEVTVGRVVNLDKLTYAGNADNLAALAGDERHVFVHGDIGDSALVAGLLRDHAIDAVMHLAAESHVDRSIDGPEAFVQTNFVGTFRLLDAARHYRKDLPPGRKEAFRFLHVSTDEVFGTLRPGDPAFTEETPYAPNSPYSASKAGSDHLARAYCHTYGLPVVTTNCSNNYGPFQFPEKLVPLMIRKACRGEKLPVYGNGSNVRDWLYVGDHCAAVDLIVHRGVPGEVYNIGGNTEKTNLEVVKTVLAQLGKPESLIEFVRDRAGHDLRYAIDASKIKAELGWEPETAFDEGMARTVAWYCQNSAWLDEILTGSYREYYAAMYGED